MTPDASFGPVLSLCVCVCVLALAVSFLLTVVDGEAGEAGEVAVKEMNFKLKFENCSRHFKLRVM